MSRPSIGSFTGPPAPASLIAARTRSGVRGCVAHDVEAAGSLAPAILVSSAECASGWRETRPRPRDRTRRAGGSARRGCRPQIPARAKRRRRRRRRRAWPTCAPMSPPRRRRAPRRHRRRAARAVTRCAPWRATTCPISWAMTPAASASLLAKRQQAARDMDIAAGQGEGVDDIRIDHHEGEFLVGRLRRARQQLADAVDVARQLGSLVEAAEFLRPPWDAFLPRRSSAPLAATSARTCARRLPDWSRRRRARAAARAISGGGQRTADAASREKRGRNLGRGSGHGHGVSTSICSGWVASIIGPLRDLTQPRTRMVFPSNALASNARPKSLRSRRAIATVKSVR